MKSTLLCMVLSVASIAGFAQSKRASSVKGSAFSVGVEAGIPVGNNGKLYSSKVGGTLQYETMPDSDIGITVSGGYLSYNLKSKYGGGSVGFVPLMAGVKYYFEPAVFFHAQLGAAFGTKSKQGTSFAYSPGLDYKFTDNVDAEVKYLGLSKSGGSLNDIGVRVGFTF